MSALVKSEIVIEVKRDDRVYSFCMPLGAPLGECYDVGFDVLRKIVEMSQQSLENSRPKDIKLTPDEDFEMRLD